MPIPITTSREKFLVTLPKWIWPFTCRDRRDFGQWWDSDRGMWCCNNCNLPDLDRTKSWGVVVDDCMSCGNQFVKWDRLKSDALCKNCGGTNEAPKGKRNLNPMTIKEDYESPV